MCLVDARRGERGGCGGEARTRRGEREEAEAEAEEKRERGGEGGGGGEERERRRRRAEERERRSGASWGPGQTLQRTCHVFALVHLINDQSHLNGHRTSCHFPFKVVVELLHTAVDQVQHSVGFPSDVFVGIAFANCRRNSFLTPPATQGTTRDDSNDAGRGRIAAQPANRTLAEVTLHVRNLHVLQVGVRLEDGPKAVDLYVLWCIGVH